MKATVIKYLRQRRLAQHAKQISQAPDFQLHRTQSRAASLYSNRTNFLRRAVRKVGFGQNAPKMSGKPPFFLYT